MGDDLDSKIKVLQGELQVIVDKLPNDYKKIGQEALRLVIEGDMDFTEYCKYMEEKFPDLRKEAKKTSITYKRDLILVVMLAGDIISIKKDTPVSSI